MLGRLIASGFDPVARHLQHPPPLASTKTMQAVFDQGACDPCPTTFNMAGYVLEQATVQPGKTALCVVGAGGIETWTYGDLAGAVQRMAAALGAAGLVAGDRVLLCLGNTTDFPVLYLAAIAADILPVPVSPALTGPELDTIVRLISPDLIISGAGGQLPPSCHGRHMAVADLHAPPYPDPFTFVMGDPNRPAYVIFTSGTGGQPRAVVHAHRAIWARRMMWQGWYGITPSDRMLHAGAFNWSYTLGTGLMDPWAIGATAYVAGHDIDIHDLGGLMSQHDITLFAAAPGVYRRMLRRALPHFPRLRHGLSAGEKLPAAVRTDWHSATGRPIYEAFGMSECSTFISQPPDRRTTANTIGYPQPGRRVAIVDENGPVSCDIPGQIAVSRNDLGLMLRYLDAPDVTAACFQGEWFCTGDAGAMAPDGAITYLGRVDDMMTAGGYRVSPVEVENAMRGHAEIVDCAAVDGVTGDGTTLITLFYIADHDIAPETMAAYAALTLARYKQPRVFKRIDALPRGANNKIQRRVLRDGAARHI